jgi:cystathionine gamma-synthase/O-succinylhomoserine sulfhydrylase
MAAMTAALLCQLSQGDHLVAATAMFGPCRWVIDNLLPRFGITATFVDGRDNAAWEAAVRTNTKVFFFETPANPTLDIVDIAFVSGLGKAHGITTVVDNAFCTSALQRPLEFGADVVAYAATKLMDGQGRVLAGAVCGSAEFINEKLLPFQRNTGPTLSPFSAWTVLKGMETLELRALKQSENALKVGRFLEGRVPRILHPGLASHPQHDLAAKQMRTGGTIFSIVLDGGREQAWTMLDALELIDISNNIGDSRSLMVHPATTTHSSIGEEARAAMGIGEGMIRMSVGLEDPDDVIEDLDQALHKAGL